MAPIRILIADDSAFLRLMYARRLGSEAAFEIVGAARDGNEAIELAARLQPDVITLDVEMPGCDGLAALSQIMAHRPTPVIMVSSLTSEGAETTVTALTLGAVDFIVKPGQSAGYPLMLDELAAKIKQAANVRLLRSGSYPRTSTGRAGWAPTSRTLQTQGAERPKAMPAPLGRHDAIIAVGSSTGGPAALRQLMAHLPGDLKAAGVIVQHMPAGFTASLAKRLHEGSAWTVSEAVAGDHLLRGRFLVAPGGYHLVFDRDGAARLTQTPPVHAVRPAVDVTMRSLAELFGDRIVAVILTGMGRDGAEGALLVQQCGGHVIAEAESTCAVYGMPRSVVEAGAAEAVAPLGEIANLVSSIISAQSRRSGMR